MMINKPRMEMVSIVCVALQGPSLSLLNSPSWGWAQ